MKKNLLLLLCIVGISGKVAAYEVSTEIQKKNILLEVFTGIHCGNCPDGDVVTDQFLTAQPAITYAIDIHSNYYAVPGTGEPDYRIDEGELIDRELGAEYYGYPGGTINRRAYPEFQSESLYVISRSNWIKKGKNIHQEDAPVNLYLKSVFDGNTRQLKITVEGYYTGDVEQSEHFLHVTLTQDNIIGPQSGAADRNNYNHRHTLRAYITPVWGDTLRLPQRGEYFSREYTYTVPAAIRSVPLKAEDLEVIAFVSVNKKEILNVTGGKPEYTNYVKPLAATLQAPKPPLFGRYGYFFFDAYLKNESDKPLTSAGFKIIINGVEQSASWTGNIPPFETCPIRINVNSYSINTSNNYEIRLETLNGTTVSGNKLQGSFSSPSEATAKIQIEIKTDLFADENRYLIKDQSGNIVHELGPFPSNLVETYNETIQLEPSKGYCFEVVDLWGDGILSPRGSYKVYDDQKNMLAQNYSINEFGDKFFFRTSLPTGLAIPVGQPQIDWFFNSADKILEVSLNAGRSGNAVITLYSIEGKRLLSQLVTTTRNETGKVSIPVAYLNRGVYLLSVNQNGEEQKSIRIIIK